MTTVVVVLVLMGGAGVLALAVGICLLNDRLERRRVLSSRMPLPADSLNQEMAFRPDFLEFYVGDVVAVVTAHGLPDWDRASLGRGFTASRSGVGIATEDGSLVDVLVRVRDFEPPPGDGTVVGRACLDIPSGVIAAACLAKNPRGIRLRVPEGRYDVRVDATTGAAAGRLVQSFAILAWPAARGECSRA